MASRDEILAWADEYLDLSVYPDYGPMGAIRLGRDTKKSLTPRRRDRTRA